ncbi:MAG: DUF349 domain-containing protein [Prolixibacteraceae bacterium]
MAPKDLTNSEEFKRENQEQEKNVSQEEKNTDSKEEIKPAEKEEQEKEAASTSPDEPQKKEDTPDQKVLSESETSESQEEKNTEKTASEDREKEQEEKPEKEEATIEVPAVNQKDKTKVDSEKKPTEEAQIEKAEPKADKVEFSVKKEEKKTIPPEKTEKPDYNTYSQIELVNALRDILHRNDEYDIKDEVEAIKAAFYKKVKEDVEEQKNTFLEEGGDIEDFKPKDNPYERDVKDLLKDYRQIRIEYNKKLDVEKEKNLELKYQIIEEIKGLINKEESINKTFNEFRELQQKWRDTGLVPQSKMKDLWENYHFQVENFYDYIKINKELRDLDLKKNLEMKIKLCEQAEELLLEPNIIKAFNALQKLHDRYREIGPVPRENKDDLWERFKAATTKINKKHQEYFEDRKSEQKKNLEQKRALCEKVEEINELELSTHKDWNEKSKEVINIQKIWRTIGFAPRKDNNKIYDRFRKACDAFFDAKREFYAKNKELQQNNLQAKIDLCVQAEALKDNTDWRKTTQDFINIQKRWKEIGPVPRKQSDAVWKRFRAACDYFFEQKAEHFSNMDSEQGENLKKKEQLIKEIQDFKSTGDVDKNLKILKDFQRRWTETGHVPIKKKDEIQQQFRGAINKLYDDLNLDDKKRDLLKFRTKISSFSESSRGQNKMRFEREKYMNKLKQLENDLVLLDNNIGFFAKSKNAESMIKDVNRKIEATRKQIELLKDKIRVIDEMDPSDE